MPSPSMERACAAICVLMRLRWVSAFPQTQGMLACVFICSAASPNASLLTAAFLARPFLGWERETTIPTGVGKSGQASDWLIRLVLV